MDARPIVDVVCRDCVVGAQALGVWVVRPEHLVGDDERCHSQAAELVADGGGGRVEAIEPDGGAASFLDRFLAQRGQGLHHVTFKVADIHTADEAAKSAGFGAIGLYTELASWKEMFLHPKSAQGIVVQLAESHPELGDDGWSSDWPYPRPEPSASKPTLVGLRLRARSRDRAPL